VCSGDDLCNMSADDDTYQLCMNICNQTFSVRICDAPELTCVGWGALHVLSVFMFVGLAVGGILCGLAVRSVGVLKISQWVTGIGGVVLFAIGISYDTASSKESYARQMGTLFAIALSACLAWAAYGGRSWWVRRRRAAWVLRNSYGYGQPITAANGVDL